MEHSRNTASLNIPGTFTRENLCIQYSRNILKEYSPEFHRERFPNIREYIMGMFYQYSTDIYLPGGKYFSF